MRVQFPLLLCFVMGALMFVQYFVPHPWSQELFRRVTNWMLILGVFAFVLSLESLIRLHATRIRRRSENWPYSVIVFVGLIGMSLVGLIEGNLQPAKQLVPTQAWEFPAGTFRYGDGFLTLRDPGLRERTLLRGDRVVLRLPDGRLAVGKVLEKAADADDDAGVDGGITVRVGRWKEGLLPPESGVGFSTVRPGVPIFLWLFQYVQLPLEATMFSLLAFFIASAAFRAFRARNVEATLLLVAAAIVILGLTPPFLALWNAVFGFLPGFPTQLKDWILEVPNMASRRAIFLGIGLGAVAQSFRIILGIERTYLG